MEIKRALTRLANRMTPQIEVMNVATEMRQLLERFEALLDYADEKNARSSERKGHTIGRHVAEARAAKDKEVVDHQTAESNINLADQQESAAIRSEIMQKSQDRRNIVELTHADPVVQRFDQIEEVPQEIPVKARKPRKKKG